MDYQTEYILKNPSMHVTDSYEKFNQISKLLGKESRFTSILDVACGAGMITIGLQKKFKPKIIIGVDISKAMIRKAKENDSEKLVKWKVGDIFEYNEKEKYDLVTCIDILEHVNDDIGFLKKVKKIGEFIVIKAPLEDSYFSRLIRDLGIFDTWADTEKRYGHIHHYNEKELIRLINKSGLKIERSITVPMSKRSKLIWEFFRLLFLPLSIISIDFMVKVSGGFKVILLRSND